MCKIYLMGALESSVNGNKHKWTMMTIVNTDYGGGGGLNHV